jgi:hypothetical protein
MGVLYAFLVLARDLLAAGQDQVKKEAALMAAEENIARLRAQTKFRR